MIGHGGDGFGQTVAADMFLADDEQIDAEALGVFADFESPVHVGGKYGAVHVEAVEDRFGLGDQAFSLRHRHELGEVGFPQLIDEIQFAVGKRPAPPMPLKISHGLHLKHSQ